MILNKVVAGWHPRVGAKIDATALASSMAVELMEEADARRGSRAARKVKAAEEAQQQPSPTRQHMGNDCVANRLLEQAVLPNIQGSISAYDGGSQQQGGNDA